MTGRGLVGRRLAQAILIAVLAVDATLAALVVAAPGSCMCPMVLEPPPLVHWLVPAIGVALHLGGLVWMVRIIRADPEARPSSFRATRR